jgi:hypothetical protein
MGNAVIPVHAGFLMYLACTILSSSLCYCTVLSKKNPTRYYIISAFCIVVSLIATIFSSQNHRLSNTESNIWSIHFNIATDIVTIVGAGTTFTLLFKKNEKPAGVIILDLVVLLVGIFGLISSIASVAHEESGFFRISEWWVGLIAWLCGTLIFVMAEYCSNKAEVEENRRAAALQANANVELGVMGR